MLEFGCGSVALIRHLLAAALGYRVIATGASPDMLAMARAALGGEADLRRLALPDDPLPAADAIASVGHEISYVPPVPQHQFCNGRAGRPLAGPAAIGVREENVAGAAGPGPRPRGSTGTARQSVQAMILHVPWNFLNSETGPAEAGKAQVQGL